VTQVLSKFNPAFQHSFASRANHLRVLIQSSLTLK
jgi:hypothetical protein